MAPLSEIPAEDTPTASMTESATYTRLHITPFDLSLQSVVIPASVLPRARNISYHIIETFPEKRFGFVDLPTMDADKLKKKLNGAVLKGTKIRVEAALPEPTPQPTADANANEVKKEKKKKSKKRKHEDGVIEGIQLEARKVKRGWTTTEQEMVEEKRKRAKKGNKGEKPSKEERTHKNDKKKKKTTVKSKYTDEPECLFKTKLPDTSSSKEPEEAGEEASTHRKKRRRKSDREVIVHEFEKTTKYPTFLKSDSTGTSIETTTFQDGVGWVDSTGKVVEPVRSRRRPEGIPAPDPPKLQKVVLIPQEEGDDDETSSSGSSSSDDEDDASSCSGSQSDISDKRTYTVTPPQQPKVTAPVMSSPRTITKPEPTRPKSSSSITSLSIKIPPTTPAKKIHPLEALYKRPQGDDTTPKGSSKEQPFSFFGNDDIEEDGDSTAPTSQVPMTPFTKQEFEFRNIRSAAPTPDTAHPNRSFNFWSSQGSTEDPELDEEEEDHVHGLEDLEEQEQEDEDVDMEEGVAGGQTNQTPASDFQKQFWESRGDLNRAWRKRRKTAAKEKRYRDNRARAERAI
ncbi:hypothetical protein O1611_g8489 [Lasiodiplodia mahajangana]|uniref:Uncharacterized protein n=1 Tax=Lasiodiplodia mahajangana TaxID=1108764 RepID=A0ACC2JCD1_9PEZI|nr:hypothetical protein O1611_g8489 [Lasiodiplodia mahajangana]